MKMIKSTKWKKYLYSKYEYPTRVIKNGQHEGTLSIGWTRAKPVLEKLLKRSLSDGYKVVTKGNCWCFMEPLK